MNWSGARAHWLFQNANGGGAVTVNQPPVAAFTFSCNQLTCSFNGGPSSDDQGITSYSWNFGDGGTATGAQVQHPYGSAGPRNVTLTVTDGAGLTDTETKQVNPSLAGVAFVGANSGNANSTTHQVAVPPGTQAGDALVLFLTSNTTGTTVANPAGWTTLENLDGNGVRGRVWTRTATAADVGGTVTVTTSGTTKAAISIAAYRATGAPGGAVVQAHAGVLHETSGTSFVSPTNTLTDSAGWVVSYWASKASVPVSWTAPAGQVTRSTSSGSGGGAIVSLLTRRRRARHAGPGRRPRRVDQRRGHPGGVGDPRRRNGVKMPPRRGLLVVMVMGGLATACAASGRTYVSEEPPAATSTNLVQLDFEDRAAPVGEIVPSVQNTGRGSLTAEIVTHAGGRILRAEGSGSGYALRFPELEGGLDVPAAMLLLHSSDAEDFLSPGARDFAFGADLLLDEESEDAPTDNGNNVVQRGLFEDTAQYKLQVDHGAFSCRVAGSEGEAVVSAPGVVEPGEWYRVSCERSDDNVVLSWERLADSEEGTTVRRSTIGDVTLPEGVPFVVGGKLDARGEVPVDATDQFNGVIDNVWFTLQDS